jgi:hypothetical protein
MIRFGLQHPVRILANVTNEQLKAQLHPARRERSIEMRHTDSRRQREKKRNIFNTNFKHNQKPDATLKFEKKKIATRHDGSREDTR